MNALVCLTVADAITDQAAIDLAAGYPKDGVNIGGGIHVSALEGRTLHAVVVKPHPTLPTAAVWPYGATEIAFGVTPPAGAAVQVFDHVVWWPVPVQGQIG